MATDPTRSILEQAVARQQAGDLDAAMAGYARILALDPANADALHLSGLILVERGEHADGLARIATATRLRPGFKVFHNSHGNALKAAGRLAEAIAAYRQALALDSGYASARINLGSACREAGDLAAAIDCFTAVLATQPDNVTALANLGNALRDAGRLDEALAVCHRAHVAAPDDPELLLALGVVCRRLGRVGDAAACFEQALRLAPDFAPAYNARGALLQELGRPADALAAYRQALALRPDDAEFRFNLATTLLQLGDYDAGWREYECRWQLAAARPGRRTFPVPQWCGDFDPAGRTLLVHAEQGFGDTLQFLRYLPRLLEVGARVVLEVQPALRSLAAALDPRLEVVARGEPLPAFDCHCPLLSLPLAFATRLDTIPAALPYLRPDPARVVDWAARLAELPRPRLGLAWSAGRGGENPHDKSVPLARLLARLDGLPCSLVGLQTEYLDADLPALRASRVRVFDGAIGDFGDTAAIVANLDLVLSIDTAVVHLAGGLGAPTWCLLPFAADWRWLGGRTDSPWYPGMRLFRQPVPGDWDSLLAAVGDALRRRFAG